MSGSTTQHFFDYIVRMAPPGVDVDLRFVLLKAVDVVCRTLTLRRLQESMEPVPK